MADKLIQLETWAAPLLAKLAPQGRRQLATTIARELRRSQQQRIAAQTAPDGTPYAPRKKPGDRFRDKKGRIRRKQGAMFNKLRAARWLKTNATAEGAEVAFVSRVVRIARVHQEGLDDRAAPGGKSIRYPQRPLLGFSEHDRNQVLDLLIHHLTP